jgi:DNA-directed RNA polymerase I subunit RPA2
VDGDGDNDDGSNGRDKRSKPGSALAYFGQQLRAAGFNHHGSEPMYSGVTGEELHADIFIGAVYYQRLRHMVADKVQVRTTGPVAALTGQPVKGRRRGGGIRVGEMERDALLAHGAAFLLQDRLLNCSDYTRAWACRQCGSFLAAAPAVAMATADGAQALRRHGADGGAGGAGGGAGGMAGGGGRVRCRRCATPATGLERLKTEVWEDGAGVRWTGGEQTTVVAVPAVLRYLDVELAAMGVKLRFNIEP